jgi:signal transduction histidine kinase
VSFAGPVDLIVTDELADDVLAVAREALVNVVKHAGASRSSISLAVRDGTVVLEVVDDGHGFSETVRRSGVANLEHRATSRGGVFDLQSGEGGTRLLWSVPYETVGA